MSCLGAQGKRSLTTTSNPVDYPALDLYGPEKRFAKMRIHPIRFPVRTNTAINSKSSAYNQPIIVLVFQSDYFARLQKLQKISISDAQEDDYSG